MPYRRSTLRRMSPVTRKYAKLLNELESVLRKGKNMVEEIQRLEIDSRALVHARESGAVIDKGVKSKTTLSMPQTDNEPGFEFP